ncbi:c-type cytochrome biogenesis protein CcmI [Thiobacter aerophilum]|uniref:C-type cytochrome biogenesis protein CcmI n=1 Tax=Thiobacter aerophilum TaxID=3121275 RepID=A0ABV0EIE0_9BURK
MSAFVVAAATLTLAAVLFVVLPLARGRSRPMVRPHDGVNVAVYQDQLAELQADLDAGTLSQSQFEAAKHELERRLLQDVAGAQPAPRAPIARWPALLVAVAIPLLAAVLYWQLGNPAAITAPRLAGLSPEQQVETLLPALEKHLAEKPDDATGWRMLGKAYMALERFPEAAAALDHAARLLPQDAQVLADYADALAMAQGQRLAGKPAELIARALNLDPDNGKALYLAGYAALEAGDRKTAARHWTRLLARLPADSEDASLVRRNLAELGVPEQETPSPGPVSISGTVRLADALRGKVAPEDTVFVFARAARGPRMPLAVLRLSARDLPARFNLDDTLAMAPQMKLSQFDQVIIGARVSKSGSATPQAGDLEGSTAPVKPGAKDVTLVIDRVVR